MYDDDGGRYLSTAYLPNLSEEHFYHSSITTTAICQFDAEIIIVLTHASRMGDHVYYHEDVRPMLGTHIPQTPILVTNVLKVSIRLTDVLR